MTWTPKRIHKSKPVASKLDHLDPTSILGQWDWELRGDYYYPVAKPERFSQAFVDEIRSKQGVTSPARSWWVALIPLAAALLFIVLSVLSN